MRAFVRRISRTSSSDRPGSHTKSSSSADEPSRHCRRRRRRDGPAASPGAPTRGPTGGSTRRRPRSSGPPGPACLRAAGRDRSSRCARPAWRRRRSGAGRSPARVASAKSVGRRAVVDEHDVEVAGVGQLGTAEAAEGDHGQRQRRPERAERRLQARLGERRDAGADVADGRAVEHVAGDHAERGGGPSTAAARRWRSVELVAPAERERRRLDEVVAFGRVQQPPRVGETGDQLGVALQDVGGEPARADEVAQPPRRLGRLAEGAGRARRSGAGRRTGCGR